MLVPVSHVNCADRIRAVNPAAVAALAASIREVGLLNPITVSRTTVVRNAKAQDGWILIGGLHRLEAAKSLGWDEIEVTVTELSGPAAVIAECDENLCGTNLSAAERALFTARRKEAYEALHPETRHGGDRSCRQVGDLTSVSLTDLPAIPDRFTADTARKTGQSERKVQRDAGRGERIEPAILGKISGTALDTGKTLDELAATPKPQQSAKVEELQAARAARLLAEEEAREAKKANAAIDTVIRMTVEEEFAEWITRHASPSEYDTLISWIQTAKASGVIAALRRKAA